MNYISGRIFGAVIGMMIANLMGAVIGFVLGYLLVDKKNMERAKKKEQTAKAFTQDANYNENLVDITFSMMGYVARGAGRINQEHIQLANSIMDRMQLNENSRSIARRSFSDGKSADFRLNSKVQMLLAMAGNNEVFISYFLEILIQIALSDGVLTAEEQSRLLEISSMLGISSQSMQNLINIRYSEMQFQKQYEYYQRTGEFYRDSSYQGSYGNRGSDSGSSYSSYTSSDKLKAAYDLLGITKEASDEDVKRAHKRLMLKYHPDRLASQGLTPEMIRLYTDKAKDIQSAFDMIKKERGFK
ncbi:MAG: co-chaperone DjlA [Succinivibrio sp.]